MSRVYYCLALPALEKTLIARQIGKNVECNGKPKVHQWSGGAQQIRRSIRRKTYEKLFADAEKEYKEKGGRVGDYILSFFDETGTQFASREVAEQEVAQV